MTSNGHANQGSAGERAQKVTDALGKFIMLWAVDELMDEVAGNAGMHRDIMNASENFSHFEPTFLHYRAGLAD